MRRFLSGRNEIERRLFPSNDSDMKRRIIGLSVWLVQAALWAAGPVSHPNIIYILLDDWGYYEMSALGHPILETPNLDRLMQEGLRFTQLLSGGHVCAPARCALMTGRSPGHMSIRNNGTTISIRPDEPTIASMLKRIGYATGGFGKWGLGARGTEGVPEKHGFDVFFGYYDQTHAHSYYPRYLIRNSQVVPLWKNNGQTGSQYSAYLIFEETKKFIRANRDRPFFCYCAWTLPHPYFQIPESDPSWKRYAGKPWAKNPQLRARAAMINLMDRQVGELVQLLQDLGLAERTVIFVSGDNGGWVGFRSKDHPHGFFAPNVDPRTGLVWRGGKGAFYEGGLRVPAFVYWPGVIQPGRTTDLLCTFTDIMPTIAELTDAPLPSCAEGISLVPTLLGKGKQRQHSWLFWGTSLNNCAVRMGHWKGVRRRRGKGWELYNLATDPGEQHNVAAQHPQVVRQIQAIAQKAYEPARPGRVLDMKLLLLDRTSNRPDWKGRLEDLVKVPTR